MYPHFLNPAYSEVFNLDGKTVEVPKCVIQFQKWKGVPFKDTFGNKPVVSVNDTPMFAEIAILKQFAESGWQARWIVTHGRRNKEPIYLAEWKDDEYTNQKNEPIDDEKVYETIEGIAKLSNNSYSGCWDVLAWKDEVVLFVEAKRNNKDSIRQSQNNWLAAALCFGLKLDNFLIVQWDFNPRCMS